MHSSVEFLIFLSFLYSQQEQWPIFPTIVPRYGIKTYYIELLPHFYTIEEGSTDRVCLVCQIPLLRYGVRTRSSCMRTYILSGFLTPNLCHAADDKIRRWAGRIFDIATKQQHTMYFQKLLRQQLVSIWTLEHVPQSLSSRRRNTRIGCTSYRTYLRSAYLFATSIP